MHLFELVLALAVIGFIAVTGYRSAAHTRLETQLQAETAAVRVLALDYRRSQCVLPAAPLTLAQLSAALGRTAAIAEPAAWRVFLAPLGARLEYTSADPARRQAVAQSAAGTIAGDTVTLSVYSPRQGHAGRRAFAASQDGSTC